MILARIKAVFRPLTALLAYFRSLTVRYGLAWIVTSQFLSWSNFLLIYLYLYQSDTDVVALVKYYNLGSEVERVAESSGRFAMALVLNRFISPIRFFVCLGVVPYTKPWVDPVVVRVKFWWTTKGAAYFKFWKRADFQALSPTILRKRTHVV
ncbi:hypothetical protein DFS34DRAFT_124335 [Phlyctochytrium arcticum]|nr:hypothetical protein DFS34DRAFT_124335 [Phlyctochytrium arcticum]